jgi:hypothetical protein
MSRSAAPLLLIVFFLACSSTQHPANLLEPEFRIRQVGGQAQVARHMQGAIAVNLEMEIINRSSEPLTVERIQVESMGAGAYTIPSTSRPFEKVIPPDRIEVFDLWAPANAENTILGANGPVTVRSVVTYRSPLGKFQKIYVRQVNAESRRRAD